MAVRKIEGMPLVVRILAARYGLDGRRPRSLAEVASEHGLSRERVREIEARALAAERRNGHHSHSPG